MTYIRTKLRSYFSTCSLQYL